jgi:lipopolysaccharide/colanic/teichoic acid biosynthesis glycosyltransferase
MSQQEYTPGVLVTDQELPLDSFIASARGASERKLYRVAKRCLDISLVMFGLLLLWPFLLLIAIAIKLHSEGPVIFAQDRVGYDERTGTVRTFRFYKFRSMRVNSDDALHRAHVAKLIQENTSVSSDGGTLKLVGDPRITGLGRLLRRTSVDELPQLFNVLKGDMSLVGPRPSLPYEVELYTERHRQRLHCVPGITGWWQVKGRCTVSFDEMVEMDVWYIRHRTILLDLKILFWLTPRAVVAGKGAG